MYIQKLLNKTCMLFSCSSVLCLILRLSQRPKRTEERFRFKCEDNPEEAAGTQMWTNEVHGEGPGEGRLRGQRVLMGQDHGVREGSWGKTSGSGRVPGASFVTSKSEKPGRGNNSTVPFGPYLGKYLFFFFFWLHPETCELLVPWPRIKSTPLQWKHGVLATGQPGKSQKNIFIPCILFSLLTVIAWKPP